ncbi:hypothetical protein O6H91_14G062100 [Diphasiastrum complanatum]|uniref:Uncharacterized protein n=1 Tax=Diphasiastrum complanatum TaxID=34168 RepID=A0ACC2BQ05_DIPCM|nr:hypothetical protein O6H91_14G062100 [Diphasiastrum complanatum]
MDTPAAPGSSSGSPALPLNQQQQQQPTFKTAAAASSSSGLTDDSLEQFLHNFFCQHSLDQPAQLRIRDKLSRNLIHSLFSLSRSAPGTLILAGLPAVFVDECTRAGVFVGSNPTPDTTTGPKLALQSQWGGSSRESVPRNLRFGRCPSSSQRGLNWSHHEILILVDSIKRDDVAAMKLGLSKKNRSAEDRWESVASYCTQNDVHKSAQQCLHKWEKMSSYFKKIYDYEKHHSSRFDSFWNLSSNERKDRSLPVSFNRDVYNAMASKLRFDQATNPGDLLIDFPHHGEDQLNGNFKLPPTHVETDLLSESSERRGRKRKPDSKASPLKKGSVEQAKQYFDHFERMENKRLQVDRQRIACDEKRNTSICSLIAEIAIGMRKM